jgi:hypothetical protein
MKNWKGFGRKWSWPKLWCYPGICQEGLRKMKNRPRLEENTSRMSLGRYCFANLLYKTNLNICSEIIIHPSVIITRVDVELANSWNTITIMTVIQTPDNNNIYSGILYPELRWISTDVLEEPAASIFRVMEATDFSKVFLTIGQTTRLYIPDDINLHNHPCER